MKAIRLSFMHMLLFVKRDRMLLAACLAPLLSGLFFKFAIPLIEQEASAWLGVTAVLTPYYSLIDLIFSVLTPIMFCFAAAMVILEEHDDHIDHYLFVTTLGRTGYLAARLLIPAVMAFAATAILLPVFSLTTLSLAEILFLAMAGALQGIIIVLLIVTLSTNKLEGMAVAKASTLTILGAFAPYFLPPKIQSVLFFLPSFWVGKTLYTHNLIYMLPSILLAFIWIFCLLKRFLHKIS